MRNLIFFLSVLLSAGVFGSESAPVSTVTPVRRDVADWIRLPGNTEPEVEVSLYARASGFLRDFNLDVGDKVKPGQVIGKIDAPDLEQDVKLAEAQILYTNVEIVSAQTLLERVKIRSAEIDAKEAIQKADIVKEKAELDLSQKQYDRTKKLFETNAVTDAERELRESTVNVHHATVGASESKIAAITAERASLKKDEEVASAAVDSAKGKLAIAEAALQRVKVLYDFTKITVPKLGLAKEAPFASVVKRFVSNGDLIAGGGVVSKAGQQPLLTVLVNDPMRVVVDVPEAESNTIHDGTQVQAYFSALPHEKPILGTVSRISPSLTSSTRSLRVEMDAPNPDGKLRAGMMAYLEITSDVHKGVLAVPATAVQTNKQGSAVFKIVEGKAKRLPIEVGYADHSWIEVKGEELSETTLIIKDVSKGMSDGALVEIMKPPAAAIEAAAR